MLCKMFCVHCYWYSTVFGIHLIISFIVCHYRDVAVYSPVVLAVFFFNAQKAILLLL